jgi:hypothetical protein
VGRTISSAAKGGFEAVDGGRLFFEMAGSGSPVVRIHSGITDSRSWDPQVGPLPRITGSCGMTCGEWGGQTWTTDPTLVLDFLSEHAS